MSKDPAFLFYASDFLTGVADLTMEERGIYITLLCLQHQKGRLSEKMMRLCHGTIPADVLDKFSIDEFGLYYNKRLEVEIDKRRKHAELQRERAKKGWEKRKNTDCHGNATAMPLENENEIRNEIINKEKGGLGENRPFLDEMLKIFTDHVKNYPSDRTLDIMPLGVISRFMAGLLGSKDPMPHKEKIIELWASYCRYIASDSFYSTKPLKTIANSIQEIHTNATNGTGNNRGKKNQPITGNDLMQAHARMFGSGRSGG